MLFTKTDPVGIDFSIQQLQESLYTAILRRWPSIRYNAHGRVYRNQKGEGYIAESYLGAGEYGDVYWDDNVDMVSFFGCYTTVDDETRQKANVHLVTFANIETLFPDVAHRADEELRVEVLRIFGKCLFGFHLQSTQTGLDQVLWDYKGTLKNMSSVDMGAVHCFRLNFSLHYNPKQTPLKLN